GDLGRARSFASEERPRQTSSERNFTRLRSVSRGLYGSGSSRAHGSATCNCRLPRCTRFTSSQRALFWRGLALFPTRVFDSQSVPACPSRERPPVSIGQYLVLAAVPRDVESFARLRSLQRKGVAH